MANNVFIRLFRSARPILWAPVLLLTTATSHHSSIPIDQALQLGLALALAMSFGFILNDLCDVKTDESNGLTKLNKLDKRKHPQVMAFAGILSLISLLLGSRFGLHGIISLLVIILLLAIYSLWARPRLLIANILAAILTASPIWLPFIVFKIPSDGKLIAVVVGATLIALGREIIFDIEDMRGDKLSGRLTLPISFGVPASLQFSLYTQAIGMIGVLIPLYSSANENIYLWTIVTLLFTISMIYALSSAMRQIRNEGGSSPEYTTWTRIAMLLMSAIIYAS